MARLYGELSASAEPQTNSLRYGLSLDTLRA